jgi:hypothetical protein
LYFVTLLPSNSFYFPRIQITRAKYPQQPHCIIHKVLAIEHGAAAAAFLLVGSPDKSAKLNVLFLVVLVSAIALFNSLSFLVVFLD